MNVRITLKFDWVLRMLGNRLAIEYSYPLLYLDPNNSLLHMISDSIMVFLVFCLYFIRNINVKMNIYLHVYEGVYSHIYIYICKWTKGLVMTTWRGNLAGLTDAAHNEIELWRKTLVSLLLVLLNYCYYLILLYFCIILSINQSMNLFRK